eukprot:3315197-Rhodomonas_salina.2
MPDPEPRKQLGKLKDTDTQHHCHCGHTDIDNFEGRTVKQSAATGPEHPSASSEVTVAVPLQSSADSSAS